MKPKRIIVADDDISILDAIKIILEDEGYEVEVTDNAEALKDMKDDFPALILLDIWMSGVDGSEICKILKSQEHTKHIPVVMISASTEIEKLSKGSNADDYILKPFDIDELLLKVKKYVPKN